MISVSCWKWYDDDEFGVVGQGGGKGYVGWVRWGRGGCTIDWYGVSIVMWGAEWEEGFREIVCSRRTKMERRQLLRTMWGLPSRVAMLLLMHCIDTGWREIGLIRARKNIVWEKDGQQVGKSKQLDEQALFLNYVDTRYREYLSLNLWAWEIASYESKTFQPRDDVGPRWQVSARKPNLHQLDLHDLTLEIDFSAWKRPGNKNWFPLVQAGSNWFQWGKAGRTDQPYRSLVSPHFGQFTLKYPAAGYLQSRQKNLARPPLSQLHEIGA